MELKKNLPFVKCHALPLNAIQLYPTNSALLLTTHLTSGILWVTMT